jgi:hypothetical protein
MFDLLNDKKELPAAEFDALLGQLLKAKMDDDHKAAKKAAAKQKPKPKKAKAKADAKPDAKLEPEQES